MLAVALIACAAGGAARAQTPAGSWQAVGPDYAGVFALARDPFDENTVYAGTFYGGLFRSADNGLTWSHVASPASGLHVQSIAMDPAVRGSLYAATYLGGIFKSSDSGRTWQVINEGLGDLSVTSIAVDPFDSNRILAATSKGAYVSRNAGVLWEKLATGATDYLAYSVAFDPSRRGNLYLGTVSRGVVRTTDDGVSWAAVSNGMGDQTVNSLRFGKGAARLYATTYVGTSGSVFRLDIAGGANNWESLRYDLPLTVVNDILPLTSGAGTLIAPTNFGVYQLDEASATPSWSIIGFYAGRTATMGRADTKLLIATLDQGLVATSDGGVHWTTANKGLQNTFIEAMTAVSRNGQSRILAGSDVGVFVSDDKGASWSNGGRFINTIFDIKQHPTKPSVIFAGAQDTGLWKSADSGSTWFPSSNDLVPPQVQVVAQAPAGSNVLYAATYTGLFTSRDSGRTWLPPTLVPIVNVLSIAFNPFRSGSAYFGNSEGRVFATGDEGFTFTESPPGLPGASIRDLAVSARDGVFPIVYAVAGDEKLYAWPEGATSWFPLDTGSPLPLLSVMTLPSDSRVVYVTTAGGGVLRSKDYGETWSARNQGLDSLAMTSIVADRTGAQLYATSLEGLYTSTDAGMQWTRVGAGLPADRAVLRIVPDPADANVLYVIVQDRGLYRTVNRGEAWSQVATPADALTPVSFDVNPAMPSQLYFGTTTRGVFTSTDSGATWSASSRGMTLFVKGIAIDPSQPSVMYAGAVFGGIFKSTDEGRSWRNKGLVDRVIFKVETDPSNPNTVYAGTGGGVARSTDNGESWAILGQRTAFVTTMLSTPRAGENDVLYVGGNNGGVFRSTDGGRVFVDVNNGLPAATVVAIAENAAIGRLYAALQGLGLFQTEDGGVSWRRILEIGLIGQDITSFVVVPDSGMLLAGTDGAGVMMSTDGGISWSPQVYGLQNLDVRHLAIDPAASSRVFAATSGGVFTWDSAAPGDPWRATAELVPGGVRVNRVFVDDRGAGLVYAATESGVFRSLDGGGTWTSANNGLRESKVESLVIDRCNLNVVYAGTRGDGIFRSNDGGMSWSLANEGLAAPEVPALATTATPGRILAGTRGGGIQKSEDGGASWTGGLGGAILPVIHALNLSALQPGLIYAGSGDFGVLKSTNGGEDWMQVNDGLTDLAIFSMAVDPVNPRVAYAGTFRSGVFQTRNGGRTWTQLPTQGLYTNWVVSLAVDPADRRVIYAGTEGNGVFRFTVPAFSADVPDPPTSVAATPGNAQARVSFTPAAFDGGTSISGFTITAEPGGATASGPVSPIVVTGLTNGTPYTFTVTATNSAGSSMPSKPSGAVTPTSSFGPVNFALSLSTIPAHTGHIVSVPPGIDCIANCSAGYSPGTVVDLVARSATGASFLAWTGCDSCNRSQCRVRLDGSRSVTATFALTTQGDYDGDGVPNIIEASVGLDPYVKDNDIFGSARLFGMQQYRDVLGREGDPADIASWADRFQNRSVTYGQMVEVLFDSRDSLAAAFASISRMYVVLFLRMPDYDTLRNHANALRSGIPLAAIANDFSLGPEFRAAHGTLTNAQFVALLFQNVLGRPAIQAEIDYHVARLDAGATRGELAASFSESPEFRTAMAHEVLVTTLFASLLRRLPDAAELAGWLGHLEAGIGAGNLIDSILASTEYRMRFMPP